MPTGLAVMAVLSLIGVVYITLFIEPKPEDVKIVLSTALYSLALLCYYFIERAPYA